MASSAVREFVQQYDTKQSVGASGFDTYPHAQMLLPAVGLSRRPSRGPNDREKIFHTRSTRPTIGPSRRMGLWVGRPSWLRLLWHYITRLLRARAALECTCVRACVRECRRACVRTGACALRCTACGHSRAHERKWAHRAESSRSNHSLRSGLRGVRTREALCQMRAPFAICACVRYMRYVCAQREGRRVTCIVMDCI